MSKADMLAEGRDQGLRTAMRILAEAEGTETAGYRAIEREMRFRRGSGVNVTLTKNGLDRASERIKEYTIQSVTAMAMVVLWGEYGWGKKRLTRFLQNFQIHTDALQKGDIDWLDILDSLESTTGIRLMLPEELRQMRKKGGYA